MDHFVPIGMQKEEFADEWEVNEWQIETFQKIIGCHF